MIMNALCFLENSSTKKYRQPQGLLTKSFKVTNTTAPKTQGDEETVGTRSPLRGEDLEPAGDVRLCQHKEQSLCTRGARLET